jgi:predicted ester cyclase
LVAPDCVCHVATTGFRIEGIDQYRKYVATWHGLFGDSGIVVADQVAEADRVATRWTTQIAPNDDGAAPRTAIVTAFYRLANGKIAEIWAGWDILDTADFDVEPDALDQMTLSI